MCQSYEATHLKTVNKLQKQHQQIASVLAEAEQLGLIHVSTVMVTRHEWLYVHQHFGCSVERQETTATHWRRLDGSELGWKQASLHPEKGDCILQGSDWLGQLACDREEEDGSEDDDKAEEDSPSYEEDGSLGRLAQRWYSRALELDLPSGILQELVASLLPPRQLSCKCKTWSATA